MFQDDDDDLNNKVWGRSLICSTTLGNGEEQVYDSRRHNWRGIHFPYTLLLPMWAKLCGDGLKPGLSSHQLALDTFPQSKGKHIRERASHGEASCHLGQHPGKWASYHSLTGRGSLQPVGYQQTRALTAWRHMLWLSILWIATELVVRPCWLNNFFGVAA